MNGMDEIQPQEVAEVTETTEAVSEQTLEDATYDADAHVEQSGNYEQSEQVETTFTEVVDSIVEAPDQVPVQEGSKLTKEVDPVTGQSKPSGGGSEETGAEEEVPLEVEEDLSEMEAPAGTAVEEVDQTGSDTNTEAAIASDAADAQRDGEEYGDTTALTGDEKPGAQTAVVEKSVGLVGDEGVDPGQIEEPQIERHLPEEEILAAGMGKHGLITEGAAEKQMPGTKEDIPGMGKGTSGGGPPVGNYGGSKGSHDGNSTAGRWLDIQSMKNDTPGVVAEPDGKGFWEKDDNGDWNYVEYEWDDEDPPDAGTPPEGDPIDPDFPMPYTGSFGDGDGLPPDTSHKPPAGPDECGFLQMIASGKMDAKSYYGYGSSGSATFSPSGGGDEDDSAHFHGGLSGGDRVSPSPDPDDWDYYTPNVLAEALARAQAK
ncbi:MAG: hypothetical protein ISS57_07305 [Anaerolineales bacterium]|nr:hypothetical protein [Anaerolineales bacterium]